MGSTICIKQPQSQLQTAHSSHDYLRHFKHQRLTPQISKCLVKIEPFSHCLHQNNQAHKIIPLGDDVYEGLTSDTEKPAGFGKIYGKDGSLTLGKFFEGQLQGPFHTFYPDGGHFYGALTTTKLTKKGTLTSADGTIQQGCFQNGELEGSGKEQTLQYSFQGQFSKGKPTNGRFSWQKDNVPHIFEGNFDENGFFTGKGKLVEPQGTYTGHFVKGVKEGQGRYQYKNGLIYEGNYSKGKKQGQGNLYNCDHTLCYSGNFENGLPNGKGYSLNEWGMRIPSHFFEGLNQNQFLYLQGAQKYQKNKA